MSTTEPNVTQMPPPAPLPEADEPSDNGLVVETQDLVKRYGLFTAVNNVNLAIAPGSIYGFIGPNGAGKTTTMRILATLLKPTSGEAWVCGRRVTDTRRSNQKAIRESIGYMPDYFGIYERMKSFEYLDFFASAYYVDAKKRERLVNDLLELVTLSEKRDSYIDNLSRGMKQRLGLARTLVHDPTLLILDEPASGLDPRARVEMRELLKELSRMGKTIIISSHILTELAEMCTHIGIIERGTLLASGSVREIMQSLRHHRRQVVIKTRLAAGDRLDDIGASIQAGPNVKALELKEETSDENNATLASWEVEIEGTETALNDLLMYLIGQRLTVYGFAEREDNIEDIFLKVTKGLVA